MQGLSRFYTDGLKGAAMFNVVWPIMREKSSHYNKNPRVQEFRVRAKDFL